jgi:hypothetical protein
VLEDVDEVDREVEVEVEDVLNEVLVELVEKLVLVEDVLKLVEVELVDVEVDVDEEVEVVVPAAGLYRIETAPHHILTATALASFAPNSRALTPDSAQAVEVFGSVNNMRE